MAPSSCACARSQSSHIRDYDEDDRKQKLCRSLYLSGNVGRAERLSGRDRCNRNLLLLNIRQALDML
jgi:hypothetical protein